MQTASPPFVKALSLIKSFVRPRDEWTIVLLAAFMFVIAVNTQTGWLYLMVAILLALLVVGFAASRLMLTSIEIVRLPLPPAWEGDTVTMRLRVRNTSTLPRFVVQLTDASPLESPADASDRAPRFVIGRIAPGGDVLVSYTLQCTRRGAFRFAPVILESATPLGLFPARRRVDTSGELVIFPKGPVLRRFDLLSLTPRAATSSRTFQRAGHSYDFRGIREYQWGDDTRFLHWPTTARTGRLMVREFREMGAQHATILVDNDTLMGVGPLGATALDDAVRMAASVLIYASKNGANISLVVNARVQNGAKASPLTTQNVRGLRGLDLLARLQPEPSGTWTDALANVLPAIARRGRLMVVTAHPVISASVVSALTARRGQITVVFMEAWSYDRDVRIPWREEDYTHGMRTLKAAGVNAYRHRAGADLLVTLCRSGVYGEEVTA